MSDHDATTIDPEAIAIADQFMQSVIEEVGDDEAFISKGYTAGDLLHDKLAELIGEILKHRRFLEHANIAMANAANQLSASQKRVEFLTKACAKQNEEISQALGRVLGYPWFKDDQKNFPGATEADGVCVGEHVAETLALEAARRIIKLEEALRFYADDATYEQVDVLGSCPLSTDSSTAEWPYEYGKRAREALAP